MPSRVYRCAYREEARQCRRNGTGNPPLCQSHRVALEQAAQQSQSFGGALGAVFVKFMNGKPITTEDLGQVVSGWASTADASARAAPQHARPGAARAYDDLLARLRQQAQQARRPPPPPPRARKPDPRPILGFAAGQRVTVDEVQRRRRELARRYHPDRAGRDQRKAAELGGKLAQINDAADQLIAELEGNG